MRHLFYLTAGGMIIFPAVFMIFSGDPVAMLCGFAYSLVIWYLVPRRFWLRFWRANMFYTKIMEERK